MLPSVVHSIKWPLKQHIAGIFLNVSTNMAPSGRLLEFGKVLISENGQVSHHSTRTQRAKSWFVMKITLVSCYK